MPFQGSRGARGGSGRGFWAGTARAESPRERGAGGQLMREFIRRKVMFGVLHLVIGSCRRASASPCTTGFSPQSRSRGSPPRGGVGGAAHPASICAMCFSASLISTCSGSQAQFAPGQGPPPPAAPGAAGPSGPCAAPALSSSMPPPAPPATPPPHRSPAPRPALPGAGAHQVGETPSSTEFVPSTTRTRAPKASVLPPKRNPSPLVSSPPPPQ